MRAIAILLTLCSAAPAQPKPPTLAMDYEVGENIHLANQAGAINRHLKIRLRVELASDGKVTAIDQGTSREHNLYNNWTTDDDQQWTTTWTGTHKTTAGTLVLDLALANRTCKHTKTTSGAAPETLPCRAVSTQVRFECKSEVIPLRAPIPANGVKPSRDVWRCHAPSAIDFDLTPRQWTLGKTACIKVLGGRGGPSYESCPTP